MLGELIDDALDVLFGDVAAIEPVNLIKDLSVTQSGHLLQVYVQPAANGLDNEFGVDGSLEHSNENFPRLVAHLVGLLSLLNVVSAPGIQRQKRIRKFPEAELPVLI